MKMTRICKGGRATVRKNPVRAAVATRALPVPPGAMLTGHENKGELSYREAYPYAEMMPSKTLPAVTLTPDCRLNSYRTNFCGNLPVRHGGQRGLTGNSYRPLSKFPVLQNLENGENRLPKGETGLTWITTFAEPVPPVRVKLVNERFAGTACSITIGR